MSQQRNAKFKRIQKLTKQARARKKEGVFVVEGWKMVREALQRDLVQELYCDEKRRTSISQRTGKTAKNVRRLRCLRQRYLSRCQTP